MNCISDKPNRASCREVLLANFEKSRDLVHFGASPGYVDGRTLRTWREVSGRCG